jgi:hypothetical protein
LAARVLKIFKPVTGSTLIGMAFFSIFRRLQTVIIALLLLAQLRHRMIRKGDRLPPGEPSPKLDTGEIGPRFLISLPAIAVRELKRGRR